MSNIANLPYLALPDYYILIKMNKGDTLNYIIE